MRFIARIMAVTMVVSVFAFVFGCGQVIKETSGESSTTSPSTPPYSELTAYKNMEYRANGTRINDRDDYAISYYNSRGICVKDEGYTSQNVLKGTSLSDTDSLGRVTAWYSYDGVKGCDWEYYGDTDTKIHTKWYNTHSPTQEEVSTCDALGKLISTTTYSPIDSATVVGYKEYSHSGNTTTENWYTNQSKTTLTRTYVTTTFYDRWNRPYLILYSDGYYDYRTYTGSSLVEDKMEEYHGTYPTGTLDWYYTNQKI